MGDRDGRRSGRKPPSPTGGSGGGQSPDDTGEELAPPAEVLASLDTPADGVKVVDPSDKRAPPALANRWRQRSTQTGTTRGHRPVRPGFPNDTNPRVVVPDEGTDPGVPAPALADFAADDRFAPPAARAPAAAPVPPSRPQPPAARPGTPVAAPRSTLVSGTAPPDPVEPPTQARVQVDPPTQARVQIDPPTEARVQVGRELNADALDAFGTFLRPSLADEEELGEDVVVDDSAHDAHVFDKLLRRYTEDFDDDQNRMALEMMADKLGRWGEAVVAAKRHLARLAGTSGEDRIWAHLSIWNHRARGEPIAPPASTRTPADAAPAGEPDLFGLFAGQRFEPVLATGELPAWRPSIPDAELAAESEEELSAEDLEPEPSSADLEPISSERSAVDIELAPADDASDAELDEVQPVSSSELEAGPPTEAEASKPEPATTTTIEGVVPRSGRVVDPTSAPRESRTLFSPHAPAATPTEPELPLDAADLIDDDAPITPPPAARRSSADFGVVSEARPDRRSAPDSILSELRAERRGAERARTGAVATGTHVTARGAARAASDAPPREAPAPKAAGVDPSMLRSGEFDAALERSGSDEERARILLERGRRELKEGKRDRAIDTFRDVLTFDTSSLEALEALEQLYRDARDAPRLIEVLEQKHDLAKTDPQRANLLVAIAEVYEKGRGDMPAALERLEQAHRMLPKSTAPLEAMARVHEALGDYGKVVDDLTKMLRGETSRSEKLELLLRIAVIQENRLDDPAAAVLTFERIVDEHPQYRGAFDDLDRLAQKSGSWRARAKLLEHQVELAKDPKKQASLLVELADLLAHAERDPKTAKKHYERAARVFPALPASWRGLEQLAIWAGEPERAEFFLEQRVRHTADTKERAQVLIELAQHRAVAMNKPAEALAAYELAHRADPTNEVAASALLGHFIAKGRYGDAAILCDVLYRAAAKADDRRRMSEILDASWEVALAMKNRGQLLSVAAARFRLTPEDNEIRRLFLETAYETREDEEALRRVRQALELLLERTDGSASSLSQLGELFRAAGEGATAESCFERVLLTNPVDASALTFLAERAEIRNDFRRAASLKERLSRETPDDATRFELLLSSGDLWLRAQGQVETALRAYEEALAIRPRDQLLLRTLQGLYTDLEAWEKVVPVQRALADLEVEPSRKAVALAELARVLEERIGDVDAAAATLEESIENDASRLDAFERLVRILTRLKDWIGLANAYRKMLGRLDEAKEPKLAYALNHQLGLVYRDRIGDADRALKCFTQAATLKPDDLEARKIVTELLVVTERLDAAVEVARATLKKDPTDQRLYRDLYELFLRAHAYDKAWCTSEAMSVLGPLTDTERQFVDDYPPIDPSEIPASLLATAWPTHIHHPDLDRTISSALQIAVSVYLRARLQHAPPPQLGTPLDQDPSPEAQRVLTAFRNACEVLACQLPALHGNQVPGPLFSTVLAMHPTLNISLATSSTVSTELLAFLATKRLAEQQPALRARSLFPSVQELKQLFFTTTQLATTGPTSMMRPGWDGGLGAVMTPDERAALRGLVAGVATTGQKLDVKRWLQLAEVTAMRAGLLITGSVLTAQRAMGLEPRMPDDLGAQLWLAELGLYAVSEQYFELRETIHVAI